MKKNKHRNIIIALLCSLVIIIGALGVIPILAEPSTEENIEKKLQVDIKKIESHSITSTVKSVYSDENIVAATNLNAYVDLEGNTYYFFEGTETQCGFQKKYYYGFFSEFPVGEEAAVLIATEYLTAQVPNFSAYSLILTEHSERDAVYHLQYSYHLNGIATDDMINIFIQENGEVGAYLAPKMGKYQNVEADTALLALVNMDNLDMYYITENEEGLILTGYTKSSNDGEAGQPVSYLIREPDSQE